MPPNGAAALDAILAPLPLPMPARTAELSAEMALHNTIKDTMTNEAPHLDATDIFVERAAQLHAALSQPTAAVLLLGEPGCGKTSLRALVARLIAAEAATQARPIGPRGAASQTVVGKAEANLSDDVRHNLHMMRYSAERFGFERLAQCAKQLSEVELSLSDIAIDNSGDQSPGLVLKPSDQFLSGLQRLQSQAENTQAYLQAYLDNNGATVDGITDE